MRLTVVEMANVKRVKAARITLKGKGLTTIGGRNGQGKTSVLDAIAYALGGEKFRPSGYQRKDAIGDSYIHIETDDGLIIDRKGKNASLTVTDSTGRKAGQKLLDAIVGKLAIDLPKFMHSTDTEKAKILLGILGIGDELIKLDYDEKKHYDQRTAIGQLRDKKKKAAEELPWFEDAPEEKLDVSVLVKKQEEILARNGIIEDRRRKLESLEGRREMLVGEKESMLKRLAQFDEDIKRVESDIKLAKSKCDEKPESTEKLKAQIEKYAEINRQVETNEYRTARMAEAEALEDEYNALTKVINDIRDQKKKLLNTADLPLPELSIEEGELIYKGQKWDCMSGAQQLIVACAIVSKLNPSCRFVLVDKLEQLDTETLEEFDEWLVDHDLQCIATRVSTSGECSLIIEDGEVVGADDIETPKPSKGKKATAKKPEPTADFDDDDY